MTLGEKLVILRKKNSLSQDELASAIRVSRQSVYKWESGKSAPDANNLIALKATFGISIDNLLDENYVEQMPEKKKRTRISAEEKARIRARILAEEGLSEEEVSEDEAEASEPVALEAEAEELIEPAAQVEQNTEEEALQTPVKEEPKAEDSQAVADKKKGFFGRIFGKK